MSTVGTTLPSQPGIHQAHFPRRVSTAGTRTSTAEAARATAEASPTPNCFTVGSPLRMKLPKTPIMMRPAAVITGPLCSMPQPIARLSSSPTWRRMATAESRNTW
jgi:hypothetical protein